MFHLTASCSLVCVTLRDFDARCDPQQVWLAAGGSDSDVPIDVRPSPNGENSMFYARLSDVIPAALKQDTLPKSK